VSDGNYAVPWGKSLVIDFQVMDEGEPATITDMPLRFMARVTPQDAQPVITKSSADASQIFKNNGPNGQCQVFILPTDTLPLPNERQVLLWSLEITDDSGKLWQVQKGRLAVIPDVNYDEGSS